MLKRSVRLAAICLLATAVLVMPVSAHVSKGPRDSDDQLARFGMRHPTFAGAYFDHKKLMVLLTDDGESLREVVAALRRELEGYGRKEAEALPARWSFHQLYDWYLLIGPRALGTQGATFGDIDEAINRIVLGFRNRAKALDRVNALAVKYGVPRAAIKVVSQEPIRPL